MHLEILVHMGPPGEADREALPQQEQSEIEQDVRDAIELIESGHDSLVEWKLLNGLYAELCKRPRNPRISNLIEMIEPVLSKYGMHGVAEKDK